MARRKRKATRMARGKLVDAPGASKSSQRHWNERHPRPSIVSELSDMGVVPDSAAAQVLLPPLPPPDPPTKLSELPHPAWQPPSKASRRFALQSIGIPVRRRVDITDNTRAESIAPPPRTDSHGHPVPLAKGKHVLSWYDPVERDHYIYRVTHRRNHKCSMRPPVIYFPCFICGASCWRRRMDLTPVCDACKPAKHHLYQKLYGKLFMPARMKKYRREHPDLQRNTDHRHYYKQMASGYKRKPRDKRAYLKEWHANKDEWMLVRCREMARRQGDRSTDIRRFTNAFAGNHHRNKYRPNDPKAPRGDNSRDAGLSNACKHNGHGRCRGKYKGGLHTRGPLKECECYCHSDGKVHRTATRKPYKRARGAVA